MTEMFKLTENGVWCRTESETRLSEKKKTRNSSNECLQNTAKISNDTTTERFSVVGPGESRLRRLSSLASQLRGRNREKEHLNTLLLDAAKIKDYDECCRLIENGANVNATCRDTGATVLIVCAAYGNDRLITYLLEKHASPLIADKKGRTSAHVAAALDNQDTLEALLSCEGVDQLVNSQIEINEYDEELLYANFDSWVHQHDNLLPEIPELWTGSTPLHAASQSSNKGCVKLLLENGADTELCDDRGRTPLDVAGEIDSPLNENGDSHHLEKDLAQDSLGFDFSTPKRDKPRLSCMKQELLVTRSLCDFWDKSSTGQVIQEIVDTKQRRSVRFESPKSNSEESFDLELEEGRPRVQFMRKEVILMPKKFLDEVQKKTCLHTAVEKKNKKLIIQLVTQIQHKVDYVYQLDEEGRTPLHLAVEMNDPEILELLLNARHDAINVVDSKGRTLLYRSAQLDWIEGVDCLLNANADITKVANDNSNVLHVAARKKNSKILQELLTFESAEKIANDFDEYQKTPLHYAVEESSPSCVEYLLIHHAREKVVLPGKLSLLHTAAQKGSHKIIEYLITLSDDNLINSFSPDSEGGITPLHVSCKEGYIDCVKVLVNFGANIYLKTKNKGKPYYGDTSLHVAARYGHLEIAKLLIDTDKNIQSRSNGVSLLDQRNEHMWQALHVAAKRGKKECIKLFVKSGCSLASEVVLGDGYYRTVLDLILYFVHEPIEFLEEVFDSCISKNNLHRLGEDCKVTFNYDLISPSREGNENQVTVLDAIINSPKIILQENLLMHPLAESFLFLKWKKLRIFFYLIFAIYCFFTFSITAMSLSLCVQDNQEILIISRTATISALAILVALEFLKGCRLNRYSWTDLEFWVMWTIFALVGWLVLPVSSSQKQDCSPNISSIAVLLSWLELLFQLSRLPECGFSVLMFSRVVRNVLKVFSIFSLVYLGFMFAMMIKFKPHFGTFWESFTKVLIMTTELDYGKLFEGSDSNLSQTNEVDSLWDQITSRIILVAFLILISLSLMNLMVGVAVSDIQLLEDKGRTHRLAKQVSFLALTEILILKIENNFIFKKIFPVGFKKAIEKRRKVELRRDLKVGNPFDPGMKIFPMTLRTSIMAKVSSIYSGDENQSKKLSTSNKYERYKSS